MATTQWALQVWRFQLRKHITNTKSFIVDKMIHNYVTHYNRKTLETLTYTETLTSFDISLAKSKFFRFSSQQWICSHLNNLPRRSPSTSKEICVWAYQSAGWSPDQILKAYISTILLSHARPIPAGKIPLYLQLPVIFHPTTFPLFPDSHTNLRDLGEQIFCCLPKCLWLWLRPFKFALSRVRECFQLKLRSFLCLHKSD